MFKFVILILLVAAVSGWEIPFPDWSESGSGEATPTPRDDTELKKIM